MSPADNCLVLEENEHKPVMTVLWDKRVGGGLAQESVGALKRAHTWLFSEQGMLSRDSGI